MVNENSFLQVSKNIQEIELFRLRPTALLLLWQIAIRAKRTPNHPNKDLKIGEALVGDWRGYCKSERCYRSDKIFLEKHSKATFISTSKGTIARIVSTSPFDINAIELTSIATISRRADDELVTTNNKENKEKNVKKYSFSQISGKRKSNPILEDPTFKRYVEVYSGIDDASVRAKMGLLPLLEGRYPAWRYALEWEEAREYLRRDGL